MPTPSTWAGSQSILGSSEPVRMALLTVSLMGISLAWGLEMTYGTPYLLQLGLSKSKTSLVWIAGPLSGLIMQPVVGAMADRSTSRYGRRRPIMLTGALLTGVCFMLLGWTREVVSMFVTNEETLKSTTILLAVLTIYALDFAINAVQACCRSLIVDTLPISQQQLGSAWASRMGASGNIIGYLIGTVDLVSRLPLWIGGETQFKKMTVISTMGLFIAVGTTCYAVTERRLLSPSSDGKDKDVLSILSTLLRRTINLPPRIQAICWVQFWSWIGWFPFLFYSSTWVGETYYRYEHPPPPPGSKDDHDALGNIGRLGSLALVIFSFITFGSSILLPYLILEPSKDSPSKFTPRPPSFIPRSLLAYLPSTKPSLVTGWQFSNLAFASIFMFAPFVRSVSAAAFLIALAGIPWAVSCWAPFAEMGIEINKLDANSNFNSTAYAPLEPRLSVTLEQQPAVSFPLHSRNSSAASNSPTTLHIHHPSIDAAATSSTGELAGVYLGVLNVYTTLPQLVGTFISWIIFSLLEPSKADLSDDDPEHHKWLDLQKGAPNAVAVCLFVGACCAVVAGESARRLRRMG